MSTSQLAFYTNRVPAGKFQKNEALVCDRQTKDKQFPDVTVILVSDGARYWRCTLVDVLAITDTHVHFLN